MHTLQFEAAEQREQLSQSETRPRHEPDPETVRQLWWMRFSKAHAHISGCRATQ